ncbi:hypothetical protein Tco_0178431 [Tanacetum coccineum]
MYYEGDVGKVKHSPDLQDHALVLSSLSCLLEAYSNIKQLMWIKKSGFDLEDWRNVQTDKDWQNVQFMVAKSDMKAKCAMIKAKCSEGEMCKGEMCK